MSSAELGERALTDYADQECVSACKELISTIIDQIIERTEDEELPELLCHEIVVAGLVKLFSDQAKHNGYCNLSYELKSIA